MSPGPNWNQTKLRYFHESPLECKEKHCFHMRETRLRPVSNRPENVSKLWETIVLIIQSILGSSLKVYFQFFAWNPLLKSRDISKFWGQKLKFETNFKEFCWFQNITKLQEWISAQEELLWTYTSQGINFQNDQGKRFPEFGDTFKPIWDGPKSWFTYVRAKFFLVL